MAVHSSIALDGDGMWGDDQFFFAADLLEIDSGDRQLAFRDCRRLRQVDGDEFVVAIPLDPFAIGGRRPAEENEIEVLELIVRNRCDDHRLVTDVRQRSCGFAGAIEQYELRKRKRSLSQDGLGLVADERQRIDDAYAIALR